jgi:ketosteroid isomerase-like protein
MKLALAGALVLLPAALAADANTDAAAEVAKGVTAYNGHDLAYYEAVLAPEAVYIAEDGAVISGREKVVALFKRIFGATPARQLAVSDVATGSKGDAAWARFKWTLTIGPDVRHGVATTLFGRGAGGALQVLQIQNTPDGHHGGGHD